MVVDVAVGHGYEVCGVSELVFLSVSGLLKEGRGVWGFLRLVGRRSSPCHGLGQRRRRRGQSRRCWSIL